MIQHALIFIVCLLGGCIVAYGINYVMMESTFIRASPVVSVSAIYADSSINLFFQLSGLVHSARIVELVLSREQIASCGAEPPSGFHVVHAERPLCPEDAFTPVPFRPLEPRDVEPRASADELQSDGLGKYWVLWCGAFRLHHGGPKALRIPCTRSLDEPVRMGIRYRFRVGFLMAEEYRPIESGDK